MDHVWRSSPVRNTQYVSTKLSDEQVGLLKMVANDDRSYCAELKEDRNGVYYIDVRKVKPLEKLYGSAERTLKTEDAISQFVRDNGHLLGDNEAALKNYVSKASAHCTGTDANSHFQDSLKDIDDALKDPSGWEVKLEHKEGESGYKVVKRKVSFFSWLFGSTSKRAAASQAVAAKFMHDNSDFAMTVVKTNAVCFRVLAGAISGCNGDKLKQAPAAYKREIEGLKKIKEEAEPLMKFEGEKKLLFLDPVEESNKGKPLSAQAKMAEKKAVAKLEKAVDEKQDGEAAYLLALYAARGVDNRSRCSVSTFKHKIESVLGRIEEGLLKLPAGSLVREACEACTNDKKFNSPSLASTFPLDPTEKQQVRVTGFNGVISNVIVVK